MKKIKKSLFERSLLGWIDKLATLFPLVIGYLMKDSTDVLLPTPGTQVIQIDLPVWRNISWIISFAKTLSLSRLLSIKVISLERRTLSLFKTPLI